MTASNSLSHAVCTYPIFRLPSSIHPCCCCTPALCSCLLGRTPLRPRCVQPPRLQLRVQSKAKRKHRSAFSLSPRCLFWLYSNIKNDLFVTKTASNPRGHLHSMRTRVSPTPIPPPYHSNSTHQAKRIRRRRAQLATPAPSQPLSLPLPTQPKRARSATTLPSTSASGTLATCGTRSCPA